ncbi:Protein TOXD, partial [Lachnellula arida]
MFSQKAIIIQGRRLAKVVSDAPIPSLRPGYVLVKTVAVAINPADWKQIDMVGAPGCLVGCDYSGIVEEIGPGVSKNLKVGDRIAGFAHGSNTNNHEDGTFAEHIMVKADLCMKVPHTLSMEQAATLGTGITTVGQALYQSLGLPLPTPTPTPIPTREPPHTQAAPSKSTPPLPILIYGGSTATGILAIQFAKLSGLTVHT